MDMTSNSSMEKEIRVLEKQKNCLKKWANIPVASWRHAKLIDLQLGSQQKVVLQSIRFEGEYWHTLKIYVFFFYIYIYIYRYIYNATKQEKTPGWWKPLQGFTKGVKTFAVRSLCWLIHTERTVWFAFSVCSCWVVIYNPSPRRHPEPHGCPF